MAGPDRDLGATHIEIHSSERIYIFHWIDQTLCEKYSENGKCAPYQSAFCGAIAGGFSAAVTTPLDVAKTRITLSEKKQSLAQKWKIYYTLKDVVKEKGYIGLFSGITPRVTMISLGGFIFFGVYEQARKILVNVF